MEPTTPNSAATEHANDDNTEPRGGDATERAATTEVMTTPAFDAATCDIAIGPCRLRCMKNGYSAKCKMKSIVDFACLCHCDNCYKDTSTLHAMQVGIQECKVRAGAAPSKQYHDALRPSRKQLMLQSTVHAKTLLPKRATTRSPSHTRLQPIAVTETYSLLYTNS